MHNIKTIRDAPDAFDDAMHARGIDACAKQILELDKTRRAAIMRAQNLQEARNRASKEIGGAKDADNIDALRHKVADIKADLHAAEAQEIDISAKLEDVLSALPNIALGDVPQGGEAQNQEIRRYKEPPQRTHASAHYEIGAVGAVMDFETAARMSGARFVVLRDGLARLERALGQFMLDLHVEQHGYCEIAPPFLVRSDAAFGTGQLPKFEADSFQTSDGMWLIPTAELSLTNLVREQILSTDALPMRLTALTPCFRSEAGAAGRDTRGMIRLKQFMKVELVSVSTPMHGLAELERMTECAEAILKALDLPYRVMLLATQDMGFAACKTYDLEVWMPAQSTYREISSCSYCGDFQARRMKARYRDADSKRPQFVHTLNGSALAVGRTLAALIETYVQDNREIAIPDVLQKYMGGAKTLRLKE